MKARLDIELHVLKVFCFVSRRRRCRRDTEVDDPGHFGDLLTRFTRLVTRRLPQIIKVRKL